MTEPNSHSTDPRSAYAAYGQPDDGQPRYEQSSYGQYGQAGHVGRRVPQTRTVVPMHPLSAGETLEGAVRLIRFNPVPYIVFPLLINIIIQAINMLVPVLLGQSVFTGYLAQDGVYGALLFLLAGILSFIGGIFIVIAGTRVTLASIRGEKLSLGQTFAVTRPHLGRICLRYIGYGLLVILFSVLVIAIPAVLSTFLVIAIADSSSTAAIFTGIILGLTVIALVVGFLIRISVALPAMVAEDCGPWQALKRSWHLTKGSFGHLLLVFLSFIAIVIGIEMVVGIFNALIMGALMQFIINDPAQSVVIFLVLAIVNYLLIMIVLAPVSTALTNLVYVNMRMRRENFHQQFLYEAGMAPTQPGSDGMSYANYRPATTSSGYQGPSATPASPYQPPQPQTPWQSPSSAPSQPPVSPRQEYPQNYSAGRPPEDGTAPQSEPQ